MYGGYGCSIAETISTPSSGPGEGTISGTASPDMIQVNNRDGADTALIRSGQVSAKRS
jgi:hypothetical protein